MEKWEEILKSNLEQYEAEVPENCLQDFQARLQAHQKQVLRRRIIVMTSICSVAAVLLAVLLIPAALPHNPSQELAVEESSYKDNVESNSGQAEFVNIIEDSKEEVLAQAKNGHEAKDGNKTGGISGKTSGGDGDRNVASETGTETVIEVERLEFQGNTGEISEDKVDEKADSIEAKRQEINKIIATTGIKHSTALNKGGRTAIYVATAGAASAGIAALVTAFVQTSQDELASPPLDTNNGDSGDNPSGGGEDNVDEPSYTPNELLQTNHSPVPLKTGIALRIPLNSCLSIGTGVEYTMYSSTYEYSLSGTIKQSAHYIGIPIRLDWSFVHSKVFEAYIGAGISADICVSALNDGANVQKDGFGFNVLAAGGIQLNVTNHIGFYIEPSLSWDLTSKNRVLKTYRALHPLAFSASFGLRFTL
ncbi:MAG: hypothetical protein ACI3ZN_02745 [Candidatus Cryptobacteroides sp.]